jgi:hypothetical protein
VIGTPRRRACADATRRSIVHFHRLDGRPGLFIVTAASRRSEDPVRLTGRTGTEAFERVLAVDGTLPSETVPLEGAITPFNLATGAPNTLTDRERLLPA